MLLTQTQATHCCICEHTSRHTNGNKSEKSLLNNETEVIDNCLRCLLDADPTATSPRKLSHLVTSGFGETYNDDYLPHQTTLDLELRKLSSLNSIKRPTPVFYCSKHQQEILSTKRPISRPQSAHSARFPSPARSITPSRHSRSHTTTPRHNNLPALVPQRSSRLSLHNGVAPTTPRSTMSNGVPHLKLNTPRPRERSRTPNSSFRNPPKRNTSRHSARSSSHSVYSKNGSSSDLEHLDDSLDNLLNEAATFRAPPPPPPPVDLAKLAPFYGYKMPCVFRCKFCGQTQPLYTPNNGMPLYEDEPHHQHDPAVLLKGVEPSSKYADLRHKNDPSNDTLPKKNKPGDNKLMNGHSEAPVLPGSKVPEEFKHATPMSFPNGIFPNSQFPNGLPPGSQILVIPPGYTAPGYSTGTGGFVPQFNDLSPEMQIIMEKYLPRNGSSEDDDRPSKEELVEQAMARFMAKKKESEKQKYLDSLKKKKKGGKNAGILNSDDEVGGPVKNKKLHSGNPGFDSDNEHAGGPSAKRLRELKAAATNAAKYHDQARKDDLDRQKRKNKKSKFGPRDSDDETCLQEFPNRDRLESAMDNSLFDDLGGAKPTGKGKPAGKGGKKIPGLDDSDDDDFLHPNSAKKPHGKDGKGKGLMPGSLNSSFMSGRDTPTNPRNSRFPELRRDKDKEPHPTLAPHSRPKGLDLHSLELAAAAGAKWLSKVAKAKSPATTPKQTPRRESKRVPIIHEPDDEVITPTRSKPALHSAPPTDWRRGSSASNISEPELANNVDHSSPKGPGATPNYNNAVAPYTSSPFRPDSMAAKAALARQLGRGGPDDPSGGGGMINFGNVNMYILQGDEKTKGMAMNNKPPNMNTPPRIQDKHRGGGGDSNSSKSPRSNSSR